MEIERLIQMIYEQAQCLNPCPMFTGRERTLDDIAKLFTSVQGLEFCMANNFPNMSTLRLFKPYNVEVYGVYIDAGEITLHNPKKAVLAGRTAATIVCDELANHNIYLMHHASALLTCNGWSVAKVEMTKGCSIVKNANENAVILG